MKTSLTPEEKKQRQKGAILGLFAGLAVATLIWNMLYNKKIGKLEAKIFKLEGWQ